MPYAKDKFFETKTTLWLKNKIKYKFGHKENIKIFDHLLQNNKYQLSFIYL
jgi:hypothetical protein